MGYKTNRTCDFCGRPINIEHGFIKGDRGNDHYGHAFKFDICHYCYPKVYNAIQELLIEEVKKDRRKII